MMFRTLSKVLLVFTLVSALPSLENAAAAASRHHHRAQGRKHHKKQRREEHRAHQEPKHDNDRDRAAIPADQL